MYTHLYVSKADAEKLFAKLERKPLGFDAHFRLTTSTYLVMLGATLEIAPPKGLFVLKFGGYLAHLPQALVDMKIEIIEAEIVRINSEPTRARPGYYESPEDGITATVERVITTTLYGNTLFAPSCADNMTVCGPSLSSVQTFNSELSTGDCDRFLVHGFE